MPSVSRRTVRRPRSTPAVDWGERRSPDDARRRLRSGVRSRGASAASSGRRRAQRSSKCSSCRRRRRGSNRDVDARLRRRRRLRRAATEVAEKSLMRRPAPGRPRAPRAHREDVGLAPAVGARERVHLAAARAGPTPRSRSRGTTRCRRATRPRVARTAGHASGELASARRGSPRHRSPAPTTASAVNRGASSLAHARLEQQRSSTQPPRADVASAGRGGRDRSSALGSRKRSASGRPARRQLRRRRARPRHAGRRVRRRPARARSPQRRAASTTLGSCGPNVHSRSCSRRRRADRRSGRRARRPARDRPPQAAPARARPAAGDAALPGVQQFRRRIAAACARHAGGSVKVGSRRLGALRGRAPSLRSRA